MGKYIMSGMIRRIKEEAMGKTIIKAIPNGPLVVEGDIEVIDAKGVKTSSEGRTVLLCRCGQSKNKPFCDRSHVACGFKDP